MTDLQKAKKGLAGHTLCLVKGGEIIVSDKRGVAPMMEIISSGRGVNGFSAADVVVGKAAAMLFVKAGVSAVYAATISAAAKEFLDKSGVPYEYGALTERIINRQGTGLCPMEQAVLDCGDAEEGYLKIKEKLKELSPK